MRTSNVVASFFVAAMPFTAHGTPDTPGLDGVVEFTWDAPAEGCPAEEEVVTELERLLGGPIEEQSGRRLSAIARARLETDGRWNLRLFTVTETETLQREMVGNDCAVLANAAALLAAMAIDPNALGVADTGAVEQANLATELTESPTQVDDETSQAEPEPDPVPMPEPATAEHVPPKDPDTSHNEELSAPEELPRGSFSIAARVHSGVSFGDLPSVGPVLRLGAALQWDYARVEVEGDYTFRRGSRVPEGDKAPYGCDSGTECGGDFRLGFVAARGCGVPHPHRVRLEFPLCAGIEGGAIAGHGVGFADVATARRPWLAANANLGVVWAPLRRVAVGLRVEGWLSLLRYRFSANDMEVWQPLSLGVRFLAGAEVRFRGSTTAP